MATTSWPPPPSPGSILIVNADLASWIVSNGQAQNAVLDELKQQNAALLLEVQELKTLLTDPVSGRISIHVGKVEPPMPTPVHPTDTLDATVTWENAEHQPIRGDATTTTWELVDDAGAPVVNGAAINIDATNDEHALVVPPLQGTNTLPFHFWVQASTMNQAGTAVTAKSTDSFEVDDTNPASGTIVVSITP